MLIVRDKVDFKCDCLLVMSATAKLPAKHRNRINRELDKLCKEYFPQIPIKEIQSILDTFELKIPDGIYCGHEGESMEEVGSGVWLRMTWYRMPSGKFEIVAYVS